MYSSWSIGRGFFGANWRQVSWEEHRTVGTAIDTDTHCARLVAVDVIAQRIKVPECSTNERSDAMRSSGAHSATVMKSWTHPAVLAAHFLFELGR